MKILLTGSSGLIGSALVGSLKSAGYQVARLRRPGASVSEAEWRWDPGSGSIDKMALDGADAIIHLAGENIGAGRWTERRKRRIVESRVSPTRALCESLAAASLRPPVLVCASAIGYYGDRGDEWLDESSPPGPGFLAELCKEWEAATEPAKDAGIRVVNMRTGIVLSRNGGALARMLIPFRLGVGGVIGSGRQFWSWIGIDDMVGAYQHALTAESLSGPVNATAPAPVTNREFTRVLARVLKRPGVVPLPAFAARIALGEMADELLLQSARVRPTKLAQSGFQFRHTELEGALRSVLNRPSD